MKTALKKIFVVNLILTSVLFFSCKKEKTYVYNVNDVTIEPDDGIKNNIKNTNEFISIAYADLFGAEISNSQLQKLNTAYTSFGDKKLIEDMVIRNFLNAPGLVIPSKQTMLADPATFVTNSYKKFFNRLPDAFESYFLIQLIQTDTSVAPGNLYYALMTSNEYRYY